jgi:uncharacterized protein Usg
MQKGGGAFLDMWDGGLNGVLPVSHSVLVSEFRLARGRECSELSGGFPLAFKEEEYD